MICRYLLLTPRLDLGVVSFSNTALGQQPILGPMPLFKKRCRMIQYSIACWEVRAGWDEVHCSGREGQ